MVAGIATVIALGAAWAGLKHVLRQNPDNDLGLVSQAWLTEQQVGKQSDRFS